MKTMRLAALPTMMAVAVVAQPGGALAVDFTIRSGQTETATQSLSGPGDTLSILSGGAVSTGGNGVNMDAASQLLSNRGTISTRDTAAYGLQSSALNARVVNDGTISTGGICSYGTFSTADHFTLINNGTISTLGDTASYGVYVEYGNHATLINHGRIATAGVTGNGITLWGTHGNIANHGTLTTRGEDATGIYVWHNAGIASDNVVLNTGTIRVSGTRTEAMYGQGIFANATGMKVINSGSVSSRYEAFYMGQADQTLTLLSGSRIEGGIRFDHADTATLNFGRGLDARLTLDGLGGIPGTINTQGQAHVIHGNVLTVVSADVVRAGGAMTAITSGAVAGVVRDRMDESRRNRPAGDAAPLAYGPKAAAPSFPDFAPDHNSSAWTRAYGATSSTDEFGMRTGQGGVLFGFDSRLSEERLVGLFGGVGHGVARLESGSRVETTTLMGGGYGSFGFGAAFVDLNATLGATFNQSERRIVNNTVAGGLETADGDYNGFFFSPSVTVGLDHDLGAARLTPSLSLLYAGIYQNGYGETGSTDSLRVGSQTTHVLTARGEVEIGTLRLEDLADGWSASVKLGGEGTLVDGNAASASLLGSALTLAGSTSTEARGFVGMDLGFTRAGYDFSARGEVGYDTAGVLSTSIQGGIGVRF